MSNGAQATTIHSSVIGELQPSGPTHGGYCYWVCLLQIQVETYGCTVALSSLWCPTHQEFFADRCAYHSPCPDHSNQLFTVNQIRLPMIGRVEQIAFLSPNIPIAHNPELFAHYQSPL